MEENKNLELEEVDVEVEDFDEAIDSEANTKYVSYGGTLLKGGAIGAGAVLGGAAFKKWVYPKIKNAWRKHKEKKAAAKAIAETTVDSDAEVVQSEKVEPKK